MSDAREAEEAGARESFEDAVLYDFEYRRRRADVNFYRRVAEESQMPGAHWGEQQGGPILDLACGTGRLTLPLLRDGHTVVGLDLSAAMLERAHWRLGRLSATRRRRGALVRGDLRALPLQPRFALAICAFHSLQHLVEDADMRRFLTDVRRVLVPGGWLAFDLLPPDPRWIHRDPDRRWARTRFRHPGTGRPFVYTTSQRYDAERKALHMNLHYQPVDEAGKPAGPEHTVRLCHRQLQPDEMRSFLQETGWELLRTFGAFDGRPLLPDGDEELEQHIYVARPRREGASIDHDSPSVTR